MANDVNLFSVNIGALYNAAMPIIKIPSGYGGITLLNAEATMGGTTNAALRLVTMGSSGASADGTLTAACGGTAAGTASKFMTRTPKAFTISTAYVAEGTYIGVEEENLQACDTICVVSLSYLTGE